MKHRLTAVAAALAATLAVAACGNSGNSADAGEKATHATDAATDAATQLPTSGQSPTPGASPTASGTAVSGMGTVKDSGNIPDPCTLLSNADVVSLTGRTISETDHDGESPGSAARYCQWQQASGQLAIFLSRTTEEDYHIKITGAVPTAGVKDPSTGDDLNAFTLAGHLYVLYGTVQVDVYSRGASTDAGDLADEKKIEAVLLPKI